MKATVITTGPGVIMATATASRNCVSVSQWCSWTTPPCRNGTIARPLPNTNKLDFRKNTNSEPVVAEMPMTDGMKENIDVRRFQAEKSVLNHHEQSACQKQPD